MTSAGASLWSSVVFVPLASALLFAPSTARAQTDPAEEEARTFYYRGLEHFNLGEYEESIAAFTRAYRAVPDPELLFNIAQSYRHLGEPGSCARALELFRNYRRTLPADADRPDVDALIAEMEACARPAPEPDPAPPRTDAPVASPAIAPPDDSDPETWPMWLTIGGAVVAATGAVLVWSISWADGCVPRCSPDLIDELRARMWIGYGLVAAGGIAATVGLVAWLTRPSDAGARAWLRPAPGGLIVRGAF